MNATPQNEPTKPAQTSWTDVVDASAKQPTREEKSLKQAEVDAIKADLKDKKVAIEAIEQRIKGRNASVRRGTVSRTGEWLVVSLFEQNTVQYLDPKSERVVFERPMEAGERQVELALDQALSSIGKDKDAVEGAVASDHDGTNVTDPESLLRAAQKGARADDDDDIDLTDEDEDGDDE